ncbi:hypothetical protein [Streptomyces sp. NPDC059918]|uniref:hypothetical protein n=1 Tax=unclassified Streptomyces TaxID=2593676 RepID=UPI00365D2272
MSHARRRLLGAAAAAAIAVPVLALSAGIANAAPADNSDHCVTLVNSARSENGMGKELRLVHVEGQAAKAPNSLQFGELNADAFCAPGAATAKYQISGETARTFSVRLDGTDGRPSVENGDVLDSKVNGRWEVQFH